MKEMKLLQKMKTVLAALVLGVVFIVSGMNAEAATLATPTGLKQTAATSTGVQYGWNPVAGATAYGCSYSADGKTWSDEVMTSNTLQVFNGLASNKTYYVRVRANNGVNWSSPSTDLEVITSPKACAKLVESEATSSAVKITWSAVEGVSGYNIWLGKGKENTVLIKKAASTTTSLIIKGLAADTKYTVEVVPFVKGKAGFEACGEVKRNKKVVTMAGAVKKLTVNAWDPVSGSITVGWKNSGKYKEGFEVQFYNKNNKKINTVRVKGASSKQLKAKAKKLLSKGGKFRVRTYKTFDGVRSYGDWSGYTVIVPQATASATQLSATSVKLSWKKFSGAESYTIYYSKSENKGYKKLATVGKNVTSFTFYNMKPGTTYYTFVSANKVKIGKKKYNSTKVKTKNPVVVSVPQAATK